MKIENTKACFVCLWRLLRSTRRLFREQYTLFCIRRILQAWFGDEATDDFIWEVCTLCEQVGWDKLPSPTRSPRKHRELLRAIVATRLGIGLRKVHLSDLDSAYSTAFPNSTPINVNKKKRKRCSVAVQKTSFNNQQTITHKH